MGLERIRKTHIRCLREQKPSGGGWRCSPAAQLTAGAACRDQVFTDVTLAQSRPPALPPAFCSPPGQTMNPAWAKAGLEERRVV